MYKKETYKEMLCPVCKDFYFSSLQDIGEDLGYFSKLMEKCAIKETVPQCHRCGWKYDLDQLENSELKQGENELSLIEYRKWYAGKIRENPDYDYLEENKPQPQPHKCPVCGKYEFEDEYCYDICPYCGWEDDGFEDDNEIGANDVTFSDYKKRYDEYVSANPNYKWETDRHP